MHNAPMAASSSQAGEGLPDDIRFTLGREQLIIHQRYETASILNDFMIGAWFLVGSILFLKPDLTTAGVWLFILGSAQLLIRPAIRLARHTHLQRIASSADSGPAAR